MICIYCGEPVITLHAHHAACLRAFIVETIRVSPLTISAIYRLVPHVARVTIRKHLTALAGRIIKRDGVYSIPCIDAPVVSGSCLACGGPATRWTVDWLAFCDACDMDFNGNPVILS